ncbi:MAG: hypothetical protein ACFFBV_00690 [Promethearchaeota archaeon]
MSEIETVGKEKISILSKKTRLTLQIVGAAIFSSLSLIFSLFVVPYLPRTPEGIAYFDPVSIIWVTCFLIFGPLAGILCCVIGMILLFPFDPFTPIGPLMKFSATFSLIIIPILLLYLIKKQEGERMSQKLKKLKTYIIYGALGTIVRIIVMVILNIVVYLALGLNPAGLGYYIVIVILLNALTSLWDLLIPYLLVFTTKLDEKFEIW